MSNFDWKTKKEKILENARRDPFLKIEELAKKANTTPRYVRTILSEANLSLMELREQYARKMEDKNTKISEKLLLGQLLNVAFSSKVKPLSKDELLFNNPQDLDNLSGDLNREYFYQSYLHLLKETPWSVSTIIFNNEAFEEKFLKGKEDLFANDLYTKICRCLESSKIQVSDIIIDVEISNAQLAATLKLPPLSPVFRVKQILKDNDDEIALFLAYFNSKQVTLSFSYNRGLIIDRKNLAG
ncbi:hypothetical protein [Halothermothrix orenii]|uniref:Uncharacterized protein n=1 Tax=Halothermothrix orenii (strain H 168 / OCM 544 / DSM 9562) TaxID=373903 RepID=B8D226_HALOH|nr:hypothetical protein [Halothermothrix orenii]ACL69253.1 hypothetical protein Hore_04950 [Halothermothrix orenii H 168]